MRLRGLLLGLVGVLVLGLPGVAVAAEGQGCPNEQLRVEDNSTLLPDCRAYEMVTPPYKDGGGEELHPGSIASSGNSLIFTGTAALTGLSGEGRSDSAESVYVGLRTTEGWRLAPLNPPGGEYVGQLLKAAEPANGLSMWLQHTPTQSYFTIGLYVRSPEGIFTSIGPTSTPAASVGAPSNSMENHVQSSLIALASTSDYSHVVLQAANPEGRWPLDLTQGNGSDLYEYSGTDNNEPTMVAVQGGKDSKQIEGFECGARLGNGYSSSYNALSSDGETIFFTPELAGAHSDCLNSAAPVVAEVWARVHGSRSSTLPAETVDVSARSESECTGACASSPESGKNFEGASEDGNKVFFTSTQQLTNGASQDPEASDDAAEGNSCAATTGLGGCNLYEFDMSNRQLRLVAGDAEVSGVAAIARDGSRVYFVAKGALAKSGANVYGAVAQVGEPNLYVYDSENERTVFIATLGLGDERDWQSEYRRPVQVTGESSEEGRFLLFASAKQNLIPDDNTPMEQLFEYDAKTAELVRVSQGEDRYNENGEAVDGGVRLEEVVEGSYYVGSDFHRNESDGSLEISQDGRTVAFTTYGKLSVRATSAEQGCSSVYEYRSTGKIAQGGVHLISDGVDVVPHGGQECGAVLKTIDDSGDDIVFKTYDPLLSSDDGGLQMDTYDARVDGGFPVNTTATECKGEGCLGPAGGAPMFPAAGSVAQAAEGDVGSPSEATSVNAAKKKASTKARRLAQALRVCAQQSKSRRAACRARVRKRYAQGVKAGAASRESAHRSVGYKREGK